VLEHPQVAERVLIKRFLDVPGVDHEIAVVRAGFRLAHGDPEPRSPPPVLGADTDRILEDIGYSDAEITELRVAQAI
jgi:crotonobetainyl-CoA:carnitine CoA-transferase CaiB-like acyl-CoA transferase